MNKFVHMTLMTNEKFLKCILMNEERRRYLNYQYPTVVLITKNISQSARMALTAANIQYIEIPYLMFPNAPSIFKDTLSKMYALTLTQFDKILFMDADCINRQSNEYLFDIDIQDYPFGCYVTTEQSNQYNLGQQRIIAGVFLIQPNPQLLDTILNNFLLTKYINDEELLLDLKKNNYVFVLPNISYNDYVHFGGRTKIWELASIDKKINTLLSHLTAKGFNWLIDNYSDKLVSILENWHNVLIETQFCFEALENYYDSGQIQK